jgi:hypothetical protein
VTNPPRQPVVGAESDDDSAPRVPGWLKLLGIALLLVVLLLVALMLVSGGGHASPPGAH